MNGSVVLTEGSTSNPPPLTRLPPFAKGGLGGISDRARPQLIEETYRNPIRVVESLLRTTPALRATPPYPRRGKIHNSLRKPIVFPIDIRTFITKQMLEEQHIEYLEDEKTIESSLLVASIMPARSESADVSLAYF